VGYLERYTETSELDNKLAGGRMDVRSPASYSNYFRNLKTMATLDKIESAEQAPESYSPLAKVTDLLRIIINSYAFKVIIQGLLTAWAAITFTFFLIRLLPGNPVEVQIEQYLNRGYTMDQSRNLAAGLFNFNPDQPITEQYIHYMTDLVQGDLGQSIVSAGTPVKDQILRFLPWTLVSLGSGLLISITVGTFMGMVMAYWRGSILDNFVTTVASILSGGTDYIYALAIILIAGVQFQLFDVGEMRGGVDPDIESGFTYEYLSNVVKHAALPALTYILTTVGTWTLLMKSSTISTLGEDYINVARARGLSERRILLAYVGRNSLLPVIPRIAISIGFVVGGSVLVERLFVYPGLGNALFTAVSRRDYMTMQGIFIFITVTMIVSNALSDLVLAWLDPRIRLGEDA
jgi:peptide/nickel transport system permease protein